MHVTTLVIAAMSTAMVAGSPPTRRSDYTTCLDICSGDYSACLGTNSEDQTVKVGGIVFECNAQALVCETVVCATTRDVEMVIENGLPEAVQLLEEAGAKKRII